MFYEGNEAGLDPPGLFDYSKGKWTAVTADTTVQVWAGDELVNSTLDSYSGNTRKVIVKLCGFSNSGAGKLIGPDGNEMDTEAFLSDLRLYGTSGIDYNPSPCDVITGTYQGQSVFVPLLFRVVTQIYGKGIVKYGNNQNTQFTNNGNNYASPSTPPTGNGSNYWRYRDWEIGRAHV